MSNVLLFDNNSPNKLTMDFLLSQIVNTKFTTISDKLITHCTITVKNGYTFTGEAVCVDVRNYDKQIGEDIAEENAIQKMWPVYGFALAQYLYEQKNK